MTDNQPKKPRVRKAEEYCMDCQKFQDGKCLVFNELYPLWGSEPECWSKEKSPTRWLKTLREIDDYNKRGGSTLTATERRWSEFVYTETLRVQALLEANPELQEERSGIFLEDIKAVYQEDLHRGAGGGG